MLDLKFTRIQFTPDLMPSDITGTDIIQEDAATGRRQMVFAPGPIFANIVLADEINRTPPKTQSALLEAMQEHRVTIQGRTYTLEEPFYVFATQNPIELEGTYPLPEAQLDRFMFHIVIEHPPEDEEFEVVRTTTAILDPQFERPVTGADLVAFQRLVRRVPVAEPVMRYALSLVRTSRPKAPNAPESVKKWVAFGASVRAAQYLVLGGKARALTSGRYHVSFDDIRALAHPVLRHRVLTNFRARVGRRHDRRDRSTSCSRRCRCRSRGCRAWRTRSSADQESWHGNAARCPARGSSIRRSSRGSATSSCSRAAVVDGFINGLHRAPYFGASVDFAEHRGYVPGDDIRRVDWRLYARTDRYYVKEYEADTNANFSVLLDVSKSMGFASRRRHEARVRRVSSAACLAYLVAPAARPRRHRHVRRATSSTHVPPSAKHFDVRAAHARPREGRAARPAWRRRSTRWPSTSGAAASSCSSRTSTRSPRRSARGDQAAAVPRQRPHRVPRARPGGDRLSAIDERVELRGPRERRADAGRARRRSPTQYRRADAGAHRGAAQRSSPRTAIDYTLLNTAKPLDHALFSYLSAPRAADRGCGSRWRFSPRSSSSASRRSPCRSSST